TRELEFDVFTAAPAQVALSAPADGAENVFTAPTLSWNAVAQAGEYLVEVATDPGFSDIVFSQVVGGGGTSVVTTALDTNTDYFWRVTAGNACGDSTVSEVFSFTTLPAPGDCADGLSPLNVFSEDFTGGANGFTTTGSTGGSWSLSSARPSPLSGG